MLYWVVILIKKLSFITPSSSRLTFMVLPFGVLTACGRIPRLRVLLSIPNSNASGQLEFYAVRLPAVNMASIRHHSSQRKCVDDFTRIDATD